MKRFYILEKELFKGYFVLKEPKTIKYIRNILRLEPGGFIELFDGKGNNYHALLQKVMRSEISGKILSTTKESEDSNSVHLVLAQALPKAGKLDDIIRMNTEIGVSEFLLFESEFGVVRKEKYNETKIDRLKRIAIEASKQSERNIVPDVIGPVSFDEMIASEADLKILLHSRSTKTSEDLRIIAKSAIENNIKKIILAIGPEGGFAPKEIESAVKNGFKVGYLNLPILRTETAGIVASGLILA